MMDSTDSLSAEEKTYFESRGETEVKDIPPAAETEAAEPQTEVVDPEVADIEAVDEVKAEEGDEKPKVHKVVPLPALTKERQKSKELSQKLEEASRRAAILEDRWNQILSQNQTTQEQPKVAERPTEPFELLGYLADKIEGQEKTAEQTRQQQAEENQRQQALRELAETEQAFRAANADYDDAVSFVAQSRDQELQVLFPMSTPEQRRQTIMAEWQQIVGNSRATRHNPAELIYGLAKQRGYVKAAPQKDPAAELEKLQEAVDGSTSLSEASGGAPETMSAQSIADMSPEAFAAWYAKPGNTDKFKRLAGGR